MSDAKSQVLVDPDESEWRPLVAWKRRRGRCVIDDLWLDEGVVLPEIGDDASAGRQHIPVPRRVFAEGPRHNEVVPQPAHTQRRGVRPAGAAATMVQDADDGHPAPSRDLQGDGIYEAGDGPDHAPSARSETGRVDRRGCRCHLNASKTESVMTCASWTAERART